MEIFMTGGESTEPIYFERTFGRRRHSIHTQVRRDTRRLTSPNRYFPLSPTALLTLDEYKYFFPLSDGHFLLKAASASDPRADRHESAEGAPALNHPLRHLRHQLAAPKAHSPPAEAPEE